VIIICLKDLKPEVILRILNTVLNEHKMSLNHFCKMSGLNRQTVYNWRNGRKPSADSIAKLASGLDKMGERVNLTF